MLHLEVLVPETRDSTAVVTLSEGLRTIRKDAGVASAAPKLAAALGNPDCGQLRPGGLEHEERVLLVDAEGHIHVRV